jgi:hypothetical protein
VSGGRIGGATVATTGTPTSVASSTTAATLLAANANRRGATIYNESTAVLYLALFTHTSVSTTVYTLQIAAGGYYELPQPVVLGEVSGVWAAANGSARITELT